MTDRPYDVITFDCYGTLIDWERGIREAFSAEAMTRRLSVDLEAVVRLYVEVEAAVEAGPYLDYRAVLTETARRIAARLNWPLPESHARFLAESLPAWRPFSDTNPALRRLGEAGYQLGILSNVDDDLLAWTRRHLAAFFEIVVTAQQAGSYKPAPRHFSMARDLIGSARWLHAAQSYFHDVVPARALGIPVAWINRKGDTAPDGGKPNRECRTLTDLADWLAP
ncbi:MAG TPA: HAD-IA family hydrolase [Candidatus Methylomirabilis sp.]|nr:HAD-IA family hydrolase [Candidatus Methylomirabilis sp.]